MRSVVSTLVVTAVLGLGVSVLAQDKPMGGQKEHTMSGCLQKGAAADTFIVQNSAEKGPKMISIVESKANLAPHVGHHIDITGVNVPAAEAEKVPNIPKADHYMRLSAIKMVSATCK